MCVCVCVCVCVRERERVPVDEQERGREKEKEGGRERILSRLHTVSTGPNAGLELMNCEIMT